MTTFLRPFFIGLCGPDGVGKSTIQQALRQVDWRSVGGRSPDVVVRPMSFATRLYEAVSAMFGVPIADIKARKNEVFTARTAPHPSLVGKSWRMVLRDFATEYVRDKLSNDHWVHCVLNDVPKVQDSEYTKHLVVVLDDLRFTNEVGICDLVIELNRDGVTYDGQHRSSKGLPRDLIDSSLRNNGDPLVTAQLIARQAMSRFSIHKMYHDQTISEWIDFHVRHCGSLHDPAKSRQLYITVRDERRLDAEGSAGDISFRQATAEAGGLYGGWYLNFSAPRTAAVKESL